ncbi:hypothetical protein yc1106_06296 [Curvularia clavata]|uniref:Major facilitator superfamily (MFS) profile domain-containing protein n=1 Tax=Curvularia clavata TaxID=95742 RepID=A0A9Q8ZBF6_CURCL|nr:hypothetical protein yc1106_06296 [Curvularia clavata]
MSPPPAYTRHDIVPAYHSPAVRNSRASPISAISLSTTYSPPKISMLDSITPVDSSTTATETNADAERAMSLRQGIRLYPKAIAWSVLISMALIMEGYSTILVPNLFSMDTFKKEFGDIQPSGEYEVSSLWQSAFVNGGLAGQILGLFLTGTLAEFVGYRRTLMAGLVAMTAIISVPVCAKTRAALLVGQCLSGIPWGLFQCVCTVYAVDVCPVALRAYLTTWINACWVLGQLIASVVLRKMSTDTTAWSYRMPLALQWVFPIPVFIAVYYAPESPWWLLRQDLFAEAKQSLRRLRTKPNHVTDIEFDASLKATLNHMVQTNAKEMEIQSGTSYKECFKGVDRRRTEITCMVWMIQTLCGGPMMGFSTYFYEQAGLGTSHAYSLSLGQFALGLFGVFVSWALMTRFGRRTLYLSGQLLTFFCVFLIGVLACAPRLPSFSVASPAPNSSSPQAVDVPPATLDWGIAALMLVFTLTYDATTGPICYALVGEIPSTRLRGKTIVLARNCYNISGIIANVITPRMLNPTAWNWGARSGFFWAGTSIIGLVWSWVRLPEPKDRTFAELDELFELKIPARRFKTTDLSSGMRRADEMTEVA